MKYILVLVLGGLTYLFIDYVGAAVRYPFLKGKTFHSVVKENDFQNRITGVSMIVIVIVILMLNS